MNDKSQILFHKVEIKIKTKLKNSFAEHCKGYESCDNDLKNYHGIPFIPGSTLKEILRETIENVIINPQNKKIWLNIHEKPKTENHKEKYLFLLFKIFGFQLDHSKIYIDDSHLKNNNNFILEEKNETEIKKTSDHSSTNTNNSIKTTKSDLGYEINIEAKNIGEKQLGIISLGILEWKYSGIKIGLEYPQCTEYVTVEEIIINTVNLDNIDQRIDYLLQGKRIRIEESDEFLQKYAMKLSSDLKK